MLSYNKIIDILRQIEKLKIFGNKYTKVTVMLSEDIDDKTKLTDSVSFLNEREELSSFNRLTTYPPVFGLLDIPTIISSGNKNTIIIKNKNSSFTVDLDNDIFKLTIPNNNMSPKKLIAEFNEILNLKKCDIVYVESSIPDSELCLIDNNIKEKFNFRNIKESLHTFRETGYMVVNKHIIKLVEETGCAERKIYICGKISEFKHQEDINNITIDLTDDELPLAGYIHGKEVYDKYIKDKINYNCKNIITIDRASSVSLTFVSGLTEEIIKNTSYTEFCRTFIFESKNWDSMDTKIKRYSLY